MKVKNIMFSGFMAAILLSASGANAASISVATTDYVDASVENAVKDKQDVLTAGANVTIAEEDGVLTISATNTEYDDTALAGRVSANEQAIEANAGNITELQTKKQNVLTAGANVTIAEEEGVLTISATNTEYDDTALAGRVSANEQAIEANAGNITELQTKKQNVLTAGANVTIAEEDGVLTISATNTEYDDAALAGRVSANEQAIETLQGDATVSGSVDKKIADAVDGIDIASKLPSYADCIANANSGQCVFAATSTGFSWVAVSTASTGE